MLEPSLCERFQTAFTRHLLIPAFNAAHLPMVAAICSTLKEMDCFGLVEVARPDIQRFGAQSLAVIADEYGRWADPQYVTLHVDHVPVIDEEGNRVDWEAMIQEGLDCGYHSVMIDGSRLELQQNIAAARKVVEMAQPYGAAVEAELGAVMGHEPGPLPSYEELFASGKGFTSPEEAIQFVKDTGVDWLSVAAGNIHGAISGVAADEPKLHARLNIEHLKLLADSVGIALVLHGGSGIERDYLLAAAQVGVVKLNIGTEIRQAYERVLQDTDEVARAQEAVAEVIRGMLTERFAIAGSASLLRQ